MGVHPYQLDGYTPRELSGLLAYFEQKVNLLSEGS